jgi:hypothetical protein
MQDDRQLETELATTPEQSEPLGRRTNSHCHRTISGPQIRKEIGRPKYRQLEHPLRARDLIVNER